MINGAVGLSSRLPSRTASISGSLEYDIDSGTLRVRITAEASELLLNRERPIRVRLLKDYFSDILKVRLENVSLRYYPAARSGAYSMGFKYRSKCQQIHKHRTD
ncbi:hypothetical protein HRbin02_01369 [Candidatus Calditenuaceae archaeon HR02]|nr:hypothetical protein HRbin02_01369 [Candidatus Calditenuaceae archaeon HR02]